MALSKSFEPTDTVVLLTVFDIAIPDHHTFGVVLLIIDSIRRVFGSCGAFQFRYTVCTVDMGWI